jgi:hypothetical protein
MKKTKGQPKKDIRHSDKPEVEAEIKILGKVFSSKGQDVKEALNNLKVGHVPKTMSVLKVKKDGGERSRVLLPKQTFRLFSPMPLMREIAIKQISLLF